MGGRWWVGWSGVEGGNGTTVIAYSINIFLKKELKGKRKKKEKGQSVKGKYHTISLICVICGI